MGLENRRSGNVSEGSNPSLSAISPENAGFSSDDVSRCSCCVPDDDDGASVGTVQTALTKKFGIKERPPEKFHNWRRQGIEAYTYFAVGKWTGRIKIGMSNDPWRRCTELIRSRNGEEAEISVVLRNRDFERAYHNAFDEHHLGHEWFAPHPDILAEIERLKGTAA